MVRSELRAAASSTLALATPNERPGCLVPWNLDFQGNVFATVTHTECALRNSRAAFRVHVLEADNLRDATRNCARWILRMLSRTKERTCRVAESWNGERLRRYDNRGHCGRWSHGRKTTHAFFSFSFFLMQSATNRMIVAMIRCWELGRGLDRKCDEPLEGFGRKKPDCV